MRRQLVLVLVALLVMSGVAGAAVAGDPPRLSGHGPSTATGTEATAVFEVAARSIRQVRYRDGGTLVYGLVVRNDGALPVRVDGLAQPKRQPRLFRFLHVTDGDGARTFTIPAGAERRVLVSLRMRGCETLSARAGSFVSEVGLQVTRAKVLHDVVRLELPDELHTGSPREAFCPNSTATSRPPG